MVNFLLGVFIQSPLLNIDKSFQWNVSTSFTKLSHEILCTGMALLIISCISVIGSWPKLLFWAIFWDKIFDYLRKSFVKWHFGTRFLYKVKQERCLLLLVRILSAHHARHVLSATRALGLTLTQSTTLLSTRLKESKIFLLWPNQV